MAKPIPMTAQQFRDALERLGVVDSKKAAELLGRRDRDVRRWKDGTLEVHEDVAIFLTFLINCNISGEEAIFALQNYSRARLDRYALGAMDEDEYSQALRRWTDHDVLDDDEAVIGRTYREQLPGGLKWRWFLHIMGASPNSGTADTLDEADAQIAEVYARWAKS
jgi:hypothetical protein